MTGTHSEVEHASFTIERTYDAPAARVFAAWEDPEARMRWGPPAPHIATIYDEADFRVGGRDVSRCGAHGSETMNVVSTYFDIVRERRIVFVESVEEGGQRLSVTQLTVEFYALGEKTRLRFTAQIAALDGSAMVEGNRAGWNASLGNLDAELMRS